VFTHPAKKNDPASLMGYCTEDVCSAGDAASEKGETLMAKKPRSSTDTTRAALVCALA